MGLPTVVYRTGGFTDSTRWHGFVHRPGDIVLSTPPVEAATLGNMRARAADLVPDERLGLLCDADRFFHRGTSGQWREWLSDEDIAAYELRLSLLASAEVAGWLQQV